MRDKLGVLYLILIFLVSCGSRKTIYLTTFDTILELKLYNISESKARMIEEITRTIATQLDTTFNIYNPTSTISRLNSDSVFSLSLWLKDIIKMAIDWSYKTEGAFEPTIGSVSLLWDFKAENPMPPPDSLIRKELVWVGREKIIIANDTIHKPIGTKLDLGGIAKGYFIDILYDTLVQITKKPFLINFGGNIRTHGKSFKIGIKHPRKNNSIIGYFTLPAEYSCATSGDYERFFLKDNRRYHHILDPRTGKPAYSICATTVITKTATDADCASTAIFVMGKEKGLDFANTTKELDCIIFVEKDGKLEYFISDRIKKKYRLNIMEEVKE